MHLTHQELFNNAWNHFVVNKAPPSHIEGGSGCLYRGPNGEKCAIGVSIPDNMYSPSIEGLKADEALEYINISTELDVTGFLSKLQLCHDNNSRVWHKYGDQLNPEMNWVIIIFHTQFQKDMEKLARDYNLQIPS